MAARKTEPLVKPLCVDAGMMGKELDQLAAFGVRTMATSSRRARRMVIDEALVMIADYIGKNAQGQ